MSVYIGYVPTFKQVSLDKIQALKVLEESSEVVDAFKAYYETFQTDWTEPDNVTDYQMARQHLLDECADVFQATSNLLSAIGEVDMTETIARCKAKNERRGYEYADDRECITDSGKLSDSREQLEADVRKVLQSAYMYAWMHGYENRRGCSFEKLHSEFYSLLDRQAAITEREAFMRGRESLDDEFSEYEAIIEATKRAIAKAGGTWTEDGDGVVAVVFAPDVDKLRAERDELKAKLETYGKVSDQGKCEELPPVDSGDTREKLEADLKTHLYEFGGYCFSSREGHTDNVDTFFDDFVFLLDRQAAITRAECDKPNWDYCETCEADRQIEDMRKNRDYWMNSCLRVNGEAGELTNTVYALEAERDELQVKVDELQEQHDVQYATIGRLMERNSELQEESDSLADERDELVRANSRQARKIHGVCETNEKLTAERDTWRDKFGKALDLAHEIARLQE